MKTPAMENWQPLSGARWQKKDSGSARKEKQQIRETCYRPNRLNLLI
jgi:hypothetical protein